MLDSAVTRVFHHQRYTSAEPQTPHHYLSADEGPAVGSPAWSGRMRQVAQALRGGQVGRVYLVHGTFVGRDAGGLFGELARFIPGARDKLGDWLKRLIDALAGDRGNFTAAYARRLSEAINSDDASPMDVRLFHWSSENHHLGRSEGALRLLAELLDVPLADGRRTLLVGHSHAGNVFALLTNLLSGDRPALEDFFAAARRHYCSPVFGRIDVPIWQRMAERLRDEPSLIHPERLDIVTLGAPIRYGWWPAACRRLLHMVSHRPAKEGPPFLARFPATLDEVLRAVGGDYVQHLGIAGTNTPPGWLAPRAWWADRRLHSLLQRGVHGDLFARLKIGQRVHAAGETLLVDYGEQPANLLLHAAGHALYTQESRMLFHFEQIAQRLYSG